MSVILIVDFGSQVMQLIARRVREIGVHSIVVSPANVMEKILEFKPNGLIFSGGPDSVYAENSRSINPSIFDAGIPILGICYGQQITCSLLGGTVESAAKREFGKAELKIAKLNKLITKDGTVWMSHGDSVSKIPSTFEIIGTTENAPFAAIKHKEKEIYGVQFHPEVTHSLIGAEIIKNFVLILIYDLNP